MKQFVYLMFVYLLSLSCSDNDHEDVMRDLDVYDGIKVSCADVEMSDMNDTVDVRVEGKDWVLADVMVDGEKYAVTARASEVVNQILPVCYEFDWLSVLCTSILCGLLLNRIKRSRLVISELYCRMLWGIRCWLMECREDVQIYLACL